MATDGEWFRERMRDHGTNPSQVAKLLGMNRSNLSRILSGQYRMSADQAADIARVLGEPINDVLKRAGVDVPRDTKTLVPVVGVADGTGAIGVVREGPRRVERIAGMPLDAEAVRVAAPSSAMDGWLCYFVPSKRLDAEAVGRLSIVETKTGEKWLRVLVRGSEKGRWNLRDLCGHADTGDLSVAWAAPVSWIKG